MKKFLGALTLFLVVGMLAYFLPSEKGVGRLEVELNNAHIGDGEYNLNIGDRATADNGITIEVVNIVPSERDSSYDMWVQFYLGDQRLKMFPVRFGVYEDDQATVMFNVFYGVEMQYKTSLDVDGTARINLYSYEEGPFNTCQDLVDACFENDANYSKDHCNKHCLEEPTNEEVAFERGRFLVIVPEELKAIRKPLMNQLNNCYTAVNRVLDFDPKADRTILRVVTGDNVGATVITYDDYIVYPIRTDVVASTIEKFQDYDSNSCEFSTLAHELTHHHIFGIGMPTIINEGFSEVMAENATNHSDVSCGKFGWSTQEEGWSAAFNASMKQSKCHRICLNDCYSEETRIFLTLGQDHQFESGLAIIGLVDFNANEEWADFAIYGDSPTEVVDEFRLFRGEGYYGEEVFFLDVIRPDSVGINLYPESGLNDPENPVCANKCQPVCDVRLNAEELAYSPLEGGSDPDWPPYLATNDMLYNTSYCALKDLTEQTSFKSLIRIIRNVYRSGEFGCLGREIVAVVGEDVWETFSEKYSLDFLVNVGGSFRCESGDVSYLNYNHWNYLHFYEGLHAR